MLRRFNAGLVAIAVVLGCGDDAVAPTGGGASGGGGNGGGTEGGGGTSHQGGSAGSVPGGGGGEGGSGGGIEPTCKGYPLSWTFPDTQASALADLQSLTPNATLTWSPQHGTLQLVTGMAVPIDCSNGVWEGVWSIAEEHSDLFQLDRTEWPIEPTFPCSVVTTTQIVNTGRMKLAGEDVRKDVFAFFVAPDGGGGVRLTGVSGFYLPDVDPGQLPDCPNAPDSTLESAVRAQTYSFSTFTQCTPTGDGTYTPQDGDVIALDETWWEWDDAELGVTASKSRRGTLVIDPSHVTDEIIASNLNCPDPDDPSGDGRIYGYTLTFDAITGELKGAMPGIGCIVC